MIAAEKDQIYNRCPKSNFSQTRNYTQILKAAVLKFKAKTPKQIQKSKRQI
nr:hypothetical protein [uncultured Campylobacter sp.]